MICVSEVIFYNTCIVVSRWPSVVKQHAVEIYQRIIIDILIRVETDGPVAGGELWHAYEWGVVFSESITKRPCKHSN